jgi:uncharacterized protein
MTASKEVNRDKLLSKGCQLCQQGKWLCIFLTYQCQTNCHFCPAPAKNDKIRSAFGNRKETILHYLATNDFEGISYSGGDPFCVFERLLAWQQFFKKHLPDRYYWVYTNGLSVDEHKLRVLARSGVDEIRFNIAATGYLSDTIWEKIKIARQAFKFVAIEIPSIPEDRNKLIKALERMNSVGIDYLNLHDYIRVEQDEEYPEEMSERFILNASLPVEYSLQSRENTESIIDMAGRFDFAVNACTMQKKEEQMIARRKMMAKIFSDPQFDELTPEGYVINYFSFPKSFAIAPILKSVSAPLNVQDITAYRIQLINNVNPVPSGYRKFRLLFIPPMELGQYPILLNVKEM